MVLLFRLITGEDVIASVKEQLESSPVKLLENPMVLMMQQSANGNVGLGIAEFIPFKSGDSVEIYNHSVVATAIPDEKILNEYNSRFGSGIIIPNGAGKIVAP